MITISGADPVIQGEPDPDAVYEVLESIPPYDDRFQKPANPVYVLVGEIVEARYEIVNDPSKYANLVEQRLADFAKERDIDVQEVGVLLVGSNITWREEAERFTQLYTQTWQAFYSATSTDWLEIEAILPVLSWND